MVNWFKQKFLLCLPKTLECLYCTVLSCLCLVYVFLCLFYVFSMSFLCLFYVLSMSCLCLVYVCLCLVYVLSIICIFFVYVLSIPLQYHNFKHPPPSTPNPHIIWPYIMFCVATSKNATILPPLPYHMTTHCVLRSYFQEFVQPRNIWDIKENPNCLRKTDEWTDRQTEWDIEELRS